MGSIFRKEKNDPNIEKIYKLIKGEIENLAEIELDKNFKTEAYNWSMLHLAVWFSNKPMVEKLLEKGFDVNETDCVIFNQHGETPLHLAACQNNQEIFDMLLRNHADVSVKNREGKTPNDLLKESLS